MATLKALCLDGLEYLIDKLNLVYVKLEAGKGLSTNDYTTAEKNKLAGLENPKIQTVKVNNSALNPDGNKAVNIDLSGYALKTDISKVYRYMGSVNTYAELPTTGNEIGDTYNVVNKDTAHKIEAGDNVSWTGTAWDNLGGNVDLSGYVEKEDGKGLSTNDYTTAEKTKLAGLKNYTHPTADGSKHVPANGTTNAGKVLTAGSAAGVYTWETPPEGVQAITNEEIDALFN